MKRKYFKMKTALLSTFLILVSGYANAQVGSLTPMLIASTGNFSVGPNYSLSASTGEVIVPTGTSPNLILTQGFQQPTAAGLANGDASCGLVLYKGITPNGDGHNDNWVIDFIDLHTDNTVEIYNRWGAMVWKCEDYDNLNIVDKKVWDGNDTNGAKLPDGTYFYIITTTGCSTKGWVEISH